MKRRPLTSSEKILLALCLLVLAGTGLFFRMRDYRAREAAAADRIASLEPRALAAAALTEEAPFWEKRSAWLDGVMPAAADAGQAHSRFLEELMDSARDRGLVPASPVLLKPEPGRHAHDLSVTLQVTGPDNAVFRWLAGLQSPEKLQVIKYLLLVPQSSPQPRMSGTVTVARLFRP